VNQQTVPLVYWPANKKLVWTWVWVVVWVVCLAHQKADYLVQKHQWVVNQKVMHLAPLMQPQAVKQNWAESADNAFK
jgi:hypothetical protein